MAPGWPVRRPRHRSTRCRWPTAAKGTTQALVAATGGIDPRGPGYRPAGRASHRLFRPAGRRPDRRARDGGRFGAGARARPRNATHWSTTTRGTGELLLAAIAAGARRVVIGIGGSATNDGGAGLGQVARLSLARRSRSRPRSRRRQSGPPGSHRSGPAAAANSTGVEIAVACDVTNPLCGPQGASAVYGPQKGATRRWSKHSTETWPISRRSSNATWVWRSGI